MQKTVEWRLIYPYLYRKKQRQELMNQLKSNGCAICGYDKCLAALDFHHINSKDKKFSLAQLGSKSEQIILIEIEKCVLLCANCHRELHYKEVKKYEQQKV